VQLEEGQTLAVSLQANPSTGYGWEVEEVSQAEEGPAILLQTDSKFLPPSLPSRLTNLSETVEPSLLGAPTTQVLRFTPVAAGKITLRLAYRRPWEEHVVPSQIFWVEVETAGALAGPAPPSMTTTDSTSQTPVELGADGTTGLPASFNWCDLGACTPVRDQGNCGSCWAFSTVGALESNVLVHDGLTTDLSEQYLLSCNVEEPRWDCGGGWFAHNYHEWKFPAGEPEAGSVSEADFPYTGHEYDPCNPPHSHQEKIVDWQYVDPSRSIPMVAAIKQAILDHGPVAVGVYTAGDFQDYTGDIFLSAQNGTPNHAVLLVGWDDTQGPSGIWYLRNSWGAVWGEAGYMRIGYGVSSVGYAANYVVYDPTCHSLDTAVAPEGTGSVVADPQPNCEGGGYQPNSLVQLTANSNPGWEFLAWSGDASGSSSPVVVTMDTDKSVTAHFTCDDCSPRGWFALAMKAD